MAKFSLSRLSRNISEDNRPSKFLGLRIPKKIVIKISRKKSPTTTPNASRIFSPQTEIAPSIVDVEEQLQEQPAQLANTPATIIQQHESIKDKSIVDRPIKPFGVNGFRESTVLLVQSSQEETVSIAQSSIHTQERQEISQARSNASIPVTVTSDCASEDECTKSPTEKDSEKMMPMLILQPREERIPTILESVRTQELSPARFSSGVSIQPLTSILQPLVQSPQLDDESPKTNTIPALSSRKSTPAEEGVEARSIIGTPDTEILRYTSLDELIGSSSAKKDPKDKTNALVRIPRVEHVLRSQTRIPTKRRPRNWPKAANRPYCNDRSDIAALFDPNQGIELLNGATVLDPTSIDHMLQLRDLHWQWRKHFGRKTSPGRCPARITPARPSVGTCLLNVYRPSPQLRGLKEPSKCEQSLRDVLLKYQKRQHDPEPQESLSAEQSLRNVLLKYQPKSPGPTGYVSFDDIGMRERPSASGFSLKFLTSVFRIPRPSRALAALRWTANSPDRPASDVKPSGRSSHSFGGSKVIRKVKRFFARWKAFNGMRWATTGDRERDEVSAHAI
ncbi:hypothetical protein BU24DRAFT_477983 [Aaosphaeria arxii CBS 175.79]|uniref:Uncharacterized protein n=1 Tax=Aaosphaeria arxii CBS 175.79 TaxID=1450172 RepID=A0A6A5XVI8_9PLEO|nr:uncharacterized protein BU24DRAFT_477983 [Aaosphaeria arxii CBS 175.79]KAF2016956.1 hypothetical protein BU24DRAFT_477983 [Aaosphaeria arxii CBS 175.79]